MEHPGASQTIEDLILAVRNADSATSLVDTTEQLAAAGDRRAVPTLVEVLGFNNPGAAVAAVDGLIVLGADAVEPLLTQLDPRNYGARAWALRALAGIGDVRGLEVLEEALAHDVGPSVRRAAARGLGQLRLENLEPEVRIPVLQRCQRALVCACADGEWVVRYAVVVGLEGLVRNLPATGELRAGAIKCLEGLANTTVEDCEVVQLRARLSLDRLTPP